MLPGLTNDKQENEDSSLMKYTDSQRNLTNSFNFQIRQVPVTHPVLHRVVGAAVPDGSFVCNCSPNDTV